MATVGTPQYIKERCTSLQNNWTARDKKFKDWYNILLLVDELEQPEMESVATNDPRTGFNLAKHLLISMIIAHKIPSDGLTPEEVSATSYLESYISKRWTEQENRYRQMGRQSLLSELVGWILATGWYSIFAMADKDRTWVDVWSPAECFPEFGSDGLVEHAHIYTLSVAAARKKFLSMGLPVPLNLQGRVGGKGITFYDHWSFDYDGDVANAIVAGSDWLKFPVKDPEMSKLGRLPIFTSPVGGLPDLGALTSGGKWQEHYGESIIATNEDLNKNYNRMRSFYQQAARSAAQHHWLELSTGESEIATDEAMRRWGSVLHGAPGESVSAIQPPAIPVELTNIMYTYQNELQRGLFPSAVFGNVQQQMSYLAMANIASASLQVLTPYIDAIKGLLSDIDNFLVDRIITSSDRPYKFSKPKDLPDDHKFDVTASVEIPGYLVQRATVAKMLNPTFKLPESWITERMFPEIKNVLESQAEVRKETAMMHPKAIIVDQILTYRAQAQLLRKANDIASAELYEKLATSLEAELAPPQAPQAPPPTQGEVPMRQEVQPKEIMAPIESLGRAQ